VRNERCYSSADSVKDEIERLTKELKKAKKAATIDKKVEDVTEKVDERKNCDRVTPCSNINLAIRPIAPVTADTSVLMDELMSGTRRNNRKNHSSHSQSRESQVHMSGLSMRAFCLV
jgi:hypothetical protein